MNFGITLGLGQHRGLARAVAALFLHAPLAALALAAVSPLQGCSSTEQGAGGGGSSGTSQGAMAGSVAGSAPNGGAAGVATAGAGSSGTSGVAGSANGGGGAGGTNGGAGGTGGLAGMGGTVPPGGAGGTGGAAGAVVYDPCPTNGDACRVMPLGDSITDGCCGENTLSMGASYRLALFELSLTNNKKLTFVGSEQSGPNTVDNVPFPKHEEGHPGWTIADGGGRSGLQTPIAGWLKATPPDIVTLMIGTNDVDIQYDLTTAPTRLGVLLDTIIETSPNALIVLAQIVPTQSDDENQRVRAYNDAMPALVKARADAGKHVVSVDMYDAFTMNPNFKTVLMDNGLHPKDAGYAVMANTWWDAIGPLLPAK
jgi:lysophospholipase L1-like esterase